MIEREKRERRIRKTESGERKEKERRKSVEGGGQKEKSRTRFVGRERWV